MLIFNVSSKKQEGLSRNRHCTLCYSNKYNNIGDISILTALSVRGGSGGPGHNSLAVKIWPPCAAFINFFIIHLLSSIDLNQRDITRPPLYINHDSYYTIYITNFYSPTINQCFLLIILRPCNSTPFQYYLLYLYALIISNQL